ncbi:MAG: nuclear transport factor 2 family protein [Bacteroidota bacterium]
MQNEESEQTRRYVENYFKLYGDRSVSIKDFIHNDFIGCDGISNNIYNYENWLKAIDYDFNQVKNSFSIDISDYKTRHLGDNLTMVVTVSSWDLKFFKDFPEFDKIRTVFVLKKDDGSIKITHLSNSISLVSLDRDEVYPFALGEFLKSWKQSLFGMGKKKDKK